ncbi:MAG: TldD/PmbA family protein [Bdellovibrionales bacterium]|nr:TldD/PmbA family protein [Bdellovibrionales bacterium]
MQTQTQPQAIPQALKEALTTFGLPAFDLEKVLRLALSNGGSLAELYFEENESTRIIFENGRLDQVTPGTDRGVGLRILFDHRQVYGYSTDLSQGALEKLAQTLSAAVSTKDRSATDRKWDFRTTQQKTAEIRDYQIRKTAREVDLSTKVQWATRADQGARQEMPDARQVMAACMDSRRKILVVNSDGVVSSDVKYYLQLFVEVVGETTGENGPRVESAHESDGGFVGVEFFEKRKPEDIGAEAAKRVKILLSAKPAPAGTMTVVLSSRAGGTMIHEAVGHGLEADLACNGLSVYGGKLGTQVASPLITVIDDGTMRERRGSFRFDDEGTASQKNVLIENGVLKGYMVDKLSAMKFDMMATGNGRRESFRNKPIVRMTNTYIAPGKDHPDQILRETKSGIFVEAMGGGQVDTVTGDFVFAVTEAYLIRDGKLGEPIRGATLVGNGPKILMEVDRVGTDLGFATGTCGKDGQGAPVTDAQPTLRIPRLTVGGEVPMATYFGNDSA